MNHASHLLSLALCVTTSIFCDTSNRTFEQVLKDARQATPVFIDWGVTQMQKYPVIPGLFTAALLSKAKESITLKRPSFIVWSVLGAVIFAEPYRMFAQEYLAQRNAQSDLSWTEELKKTQESAKIAGQAVVLAAQKGSQEVVEKVSEKIDEFTGNDSK